MLHKGNLLLRDSAPVRAHGVQAAAVVAGVGHARAFVDVVTVRREADASRAQALKLFCNTYRKYSIDA